MEEPGGLRSMGSWRVGHDWATSLSLFTFMHWRRQWQPTPVLLPGESQGRGSLVGSCLWGRTESDTTEGLHFHFSLSCTGEGNGNPLRCSCLGNPRDGGAWWAAIYGVTQSRTQLRWLSSCCWGWDGWMASPTQWTQVWTNSRRWWRTVKPGMLQSMGSQRVRHNLATEQQQQKLNPKKGKIKVEFNKLRHKYKIGIINKTQSWILWKNNKICFKSQ